MGGMKKPLLRWGSRSGAEPKQDAYGNDIKQGGGCLSCFRKHEKCNDVDLEASPSEDKFLEKDENMYFFGKLKRRQYMALICVSVTAVFFAIMAPVTTEVIVPQMAQQAMNDAVLEFESLVITDPTDTTMTVTAKGAIRKTGPYDGSTEPFVVTVEFRDQFLASMEMPAQKLKGGQDTEFELTSVLELPSSDVFNGFAAALIDEKEVVWRLYGKTTVKAVVGGIQFTAKGIKFDKEVTLRAFDGLQQVELLVFDLSQSTPTEVLVDMEISLFNPSVVAMEPLGVLSFDIFYKGSHMGNLTSDGEVFLSSGDNLLRMSGTVQPDDLDIANELISRYLSNLVTDVTAVAGPSASSIGLYNAALDGLELTTALLGDDIRVIENVEFTSMTVVPVDNSVVEFSAASRIFVDNPLGPGSPIDIQEVTMELELQFQEPGVPDLTTVGMISIPPLNITNGTSVVIDLEISAAMVMTGTDGEPFSRFVTQFFNEPEVELVLSGTSDVFAITALGEQKLAGMPVQNTVRLVGLGGVPDAELIEFDLPRDAPEGGVEVLLDVNLPNPSIASMNLGPVSFDVVYDGVFMGRVSADDVTIVPGSNEMSMRGFLLPAGEDLAKASEFMSAYLEGVDQGVSARGYPLSETVKWQQEMMRNVAVDMVFPGAEDLDLVPTFEIVTMELSFREDPSVPRSNIDILASINIPFDFPLDVLSASEEGTLSYNGTVMAAMTVSETAVDYNPDTNEIRMQPVNVPVEPVDEEVFGEFMASLVTTESDVATLQGVLEAKVSTAMGVLTVRTTLTKEVPLEGMNGFNDPPIAITALTGTGGCASNCMDVRVSTTLTNPANVFGHLGTIAFGIVYQGKQVGYSVVDDLEIGLGETDLILWGQYVEDPVGDERSIDFLSRWIQGLDSELELVGLPDLTPNTLLHPALNAMVSRTTLPGLDTPLIAYAKMNTLTTLFTNLIPTQLDIYNPLEVTLEMTRVDFLVYWGDTLMGSISESLLDDPIVLPPLLTTRARSLDIVVESGFVDLVIAFGDALFGGIDLYITGEQDLRIGAFTGMAYYSQDPTRAGL